MENKITFDLKCPVGVNLYDYYLGLIDFLGFELGKYTIVEIHNKEILDKFKLEKEIQIADTLAKTYVQKAELLRKQLGKQKINEDFE